MSANDEPILIAMAHALYTATGGDCDVAPSEMALVLEAARREPVAHPANHPPRMVTGDGTGELPALPNPIQYEHREPRERYTSNQMRDYARAAVAQALKGRGAVVIDSDGKEKRRGDKNLPSAGGVEKITTLSIAGPVTDEQVAAIDLLISQGWVQAADALRTHFLGTAQP